MKIRIAQTASEKEQAFQVRQTVFVLEQRVPPEEEMDEYDEQSIHFLGVVDEKPVAASRLRFIDIYGKLERICVLQSYRGQSFGKQMIQFMEKYIWENGYTNAKLNAQTHALNFYKHLGYKVISDTFLDAGIPHVTMIKELSKPV